MSRKQADTILDEITYDIERFTEWGTWSVEFTKLKGMDMAKARAQQLLGHYRERNLATKIRIVTCRRSEFDCFSITGQS